MESMEKETHTTGQQLNISTPILEPFTPSEEKSPKYISLQEVSNKKG